MNRVKVWKRVFIGFVLIFIFLATFQLIKSLEIPPTTVGYFVLITWGSLSLVAAIGIILITLVQFFPKRAEKRRKEEQRRIEENFSKGLLTSRSVDKAEKLVSQYKDKSTVAKVLDDPRINSEDLLKEVIETYSQRKVRNLVHYLSDIGKGYRVIGYILRHLIKHKKIPQKQARVLTYTMGKLMPKDDIIDRLYEKV